MGLKSRGQVDLSAAGLAKVECQHANASSFAKATTDGRPDKCLVVKAGREGRFWGVNFDFRCRGWPAPKIKHLMRLFPRSSEDRAVPVSRCHASED